MEYAFGKSSMEKLSTVHPILREVAVKAIGLTPVDFTIVWGWRSQVEQNRMVAERKSRTPWPGSKHNALLDGEPCSQAFDVAPVVDGKIPWTDSHLFCLLAGVIFVAAKEKGVRLRWGGDFSGNWLTTDQTFLDWGHFELVLS